MCHSAVVKRTRIRMIWFRSVLASALGSNRLDLVKLRFPSNFAHKLLRKEGIAIPQFESSKLWDTIIVMFSIAISVFIITLSEKDLATDAWGTGG